jgi:hypothetical protein
VTGAADTTTVPALSAAWAETILLANGAQAERWQGIFDKISSLVVDGATTGIDERSVTESIDRADDLLAEAAWDLWQTYPHHAPSAADALHGWWTGTATRFGKAILILDAFSFREMHQFLTATGERGVVPTGAYVRGSAIPSDTQAFAVALGLTGRAQLRASGAGRSFRLATRNLMTDVPTDSFDALAASIPTERNIVLWHPWLDDLIHSNQHRPNAATMISKIAQDTLNGDGFWRLIDVLRTGRDLVITSDHGYAASRGFAELPQDLGKRMAEVFGAKRCANTPATELVLAAGQPLYVLAQNGGRAAVIGHRKWAVAGGYPHVTHGGLTLAEVCIPIIHLAAL